MAANEKSKPAAKAAPKAKAAAKTVKPKAASAAATKVSAVAKAKPAPQKEQNNMKEEMNNFKDKAADTARSAAERGKERASEAIVSIGKLLRDSAATLDENVGANYGDYARKAADSVDDFAGKVNVKKVDDIVDDAREFARKSPAVAIGAAAAIGFVLVRLFRSGKDA